MEVQDFLRKYGEFGLTLLNAQYGIVATKDEEGKRVILNYDQIESPKFDPIVKECRGLCLEIGTWNILARGFFRFFNIGEDNGV